MNSTVEDNDDDNKNTSSYQGKYGGPALPETTCGMKSENDDETAHTIPQDHTHEDNCPDRTIVEHEDSYEQQQQQQQQRHQCCSSCWFGRNLEALGWCLDATGRTVAIISIGAFLMPAFLHLATEAAGCSSSEVEKNCDKTIHGIRPSSLLTMVHTIVSVCSAPLVPLFGAIVDHTQHRRAVGRLVSTTFCLLLFSQIFLSEKTWFPLAIVLIVLFFLFIFQMLAAYAYLPELTKEVQELNNFTRNFTVISFSTIVIFVAAIVGGTTGSGITDKVLVARIAVSAAFVISSITLFFAWFKLFKKRSQLQELPEGETIWTAGFRKLYRTSKKIYLEYRALKWFLVAIAFCDGATQALMTIIITFFSDQLNFSAKDIGVAALILLLANIPAGFLSGWCSRLLNPVRSSIVAICILIAVTSAAAIVLKGPEQQTEAFILTFLWGFGTGWKFTCDRMTVCTVIPSHQNAEYMGIYIFFSMILTWAPPLIFTSLNEAGVSQRVGVATLNVFFIVALICYCLMGAYREAVETTNGAIAPSILSSRRENLRKENDQIRARKENV